MKEHDNTETYITVTFCPKHEQHSKDSHKATVNGDCHNFQDPLNSAQV